MRRLYKLDPQRRVEVMNRLAEELAHEQEALFAYVYGSFLDSEGFHDVDVGVYVKTEAPERLLNLAVVLAQRLSERVKLPVDVRILNLAPVSFRYHVLTGKVLFSRDEARLAHVVEDTMCRYLDIAPLLRRSAKEAFAA
jgi:predicted nucleotidyltransferase